MKYVPYSCFLIVSLLFACKKNTTTTEPVNPDPEVSLPDIRFQNSIKESAGAVEVNEKMGAVLLHTMFNENADPSNFTILYNVVSPYSTDPASGTVLNLTTPKKVFIKKGTDTVKSYTISQTRAAFKVGMHQQNSSYTVGTNYLLKRYAETAGTQLNLIFIHTNKEQLKIFIEGAVENGKIKAGTYTSPNISADLIWGKTNVSPMLGKVEGNVVIEKYNDAENTVKGRINIKYVFSWINGYPYEWTAAEGWFDQIPLQP